MNEDPFVHITSKRKIKFKKHKRYEKYLRDTKKSQEIGKKNTRDTKKTQEMRRTFFKGMLVHSTCKRKNYKWKKHLFKQQKFLYNRYSVGGRRHGAWLALWAMDTCMHCPRPYQYAHGHN
jgi:hypothetical protein